MRLATIECSFQLDSVAIALGFSNGNQCVIKKVRYFEKYRRVEIEGAVPQVNCVCASSRVFAEICVGLIMKSLDAFEISTNHSAEKNMGVLGLDVQSLMRSTRIAKRRDQPPREVYLRFENILDIDDQARVLAELTLVLDGMGFCDGVDIIAQTTNFYCVLKKPRLALKALAEKVAAFQSLGNCVLEDMDEVALIG
jgi:hypothetical protein